MEENTNQFLSKIWGETTLHTVSKQAVVFLHPADDNEVPNPAVPQVNLTTSRSTG